MSQNHQKLQNLIDKLKKILSKQDKKEDLKEKQNFAEERKKKFLEKYGHLDNSD